MISEQWRLCWGRFKNKTKIQNSKFIEFCFLFLIFILGSSLSQVAPFPTTSVALFLLETLCNI